MIRHGVRLSWRQRQQARRWQPPQRARPSAHAHAPPREACRSCAPRRRLPPCQRGAACRPCGCARARGARSCGPCRCAASGCGACTAGRGDGWVTRVRVGKHSGWRGSWGRKRQLIPHAARPPHAYALHPHCLHAAPGFPVRASHLAGLGLEVVQGAEVLAQQLLELQRVRVGGREGGRGRGSGVHSWCLPVHQEGERGGQEGSTRAGQKRGRRVGA